VLSTTLRPFRSRIGPRNAGTRISRAWLFRAASRYVVPERTSSAHSRKKSAPKTASATAPTIAIRNASCGVRRYGSSTRGSGGRNLLLPARCPALAKEAHLADPTGGLTRREEPPAEAVDRQRQEDVEHDLLRQRVDEHEPRWRRLPEQVVEDERPDRRQRRDHGDRREWCVPAIAAGRL